MKWGLVLTDSFSTQNSSFQARKTLLTILQEDTIQVHYSSWIYSKWKLCRWNQTVPKNLILIVHCSGTRNRRSMPRPSEKISRQLYWVARVPGLQCCWWRNWFGFGFVAVGKIVRRLWKEVEAQLHHLSFSSGIAFLQFFTNDIVTMVATFILHFLNNRFLPQLWNPTTASSPLTLSSSTQTWPYFSTTKPSTTSAENH